MKTRWWRIMTLESVFFTSLQCARLRNSAYFNLALHCRPWRFPIDAERSEQGAWVKVAGASPVPSWLTTAPELSYGQMATFLTFHEQSFGVTKYGDVIRLMQRIVLHFAIASIVWPNGQTNQLNQGWANPQTLIIFCSSACWNQTTQLAHSPWLLQNL